MNTPHAAMVERAERLLAAVEGMTAAPWSWDGEFPLTVLDGKDHVVSNFYPSGETNSTGIIALRNDAPEIIRSLLQALEAERGNLRLTIQTSMRLAAMLEKIVRVADRNPFCSVGHVIEHVVPEARAEFPPLSDEEPQGPSSLELKTGG